MDTSGSDYYQGGPGPNILDIPALMDMPPFQGGGGAGGGGGAAGPMGPPGPNNFGGKSWSSTLFMAYSDSLNGTGTGTNIMSNTSHCNLNRIGITQRLL